RLFIKEAGRKVDLLAFLNSAYNTDDYMEEIFGQKSKIITINISTYGILEAGNAKTYHEVTSCMFIDRKTGCLINRESAEACVGEWIDGRKWKTDDGAVIDLAVKRKSILDRTTADAYLLRKENYGRCQMQ
uniref:hypothetical protein n=1 Tax=Chromobacterium sp. ASV23 TaxID=2795110 RepID=UPI0018EA89F5